MLKSKSAFFISLLFAAQLASAGGVMLEKQSSSRADQPLNDSVILEKGIIVQNKLAGGLVIEKSPVLNRCGGQILEKSIILQKSQLAGGMVLERGGIKLLSGGMILERGGIIMDDNLLAGGLIIDRHGRSV
ncbi:MAG TPA: hypothetical protein VL995_12785 [Cellvibrio sp.]|nr:hypothetical protein [Cellvibrio sp.]